MKHDNHKITSLLHDGRNNAFTLIELLVVISIIALLIALLLPALQAARTAGKVTKGTSQARQIEIALSMYSDTNNSYLPYASMGTKSDTGPFWPNLLLNGDFINSQEFFYSPDHNRNITPANINNLKFSGFGAYTSGVMPTLYRSTSTAGILNGHLPYNFDKVSFPNPSDLLTIADTFSGSPLTSDGSFAVTTTLFNYNGRVIRAYADGHVESNQAVNLRYVVIDARQGFFDYNQNGILESDSADQISRYWFAPWYSRFFGSGVYPVAAATY